MRPAEAILAQLFGLQHSSECYRINRERNALVHPTFQDFHCHCGVEEALQRRLNRLIRQTPSRLLEELDDES